MNHDGDLQIQLAMKSLMAFHVFLQKAVFLKIIHYHFPRIFPSSSYTWRPASRMNRAVCCRSLIWSSSFCSREVCSGHNFSLSVLRVVTTHPFKTILCSLKSCSSILTRAIESRPVSLFFWQHHIMLSLCTNIIPKRSAKTQSAFGPLAHGCLQHVHCKVTWYDICRCKQIHTK